MKNSYYKARWSKLQTLVRRLRAPGLKLDIHCVIYRMKSLQGSCDIPRYWISLDGAIIWDYPRQFMGQGYLKPGVRYPYPYGTDISEISDLLREYVDTPRSELMSRAFTGDQWGLADILRAADRRIGHAQLLRLHERTESAAARAVIERRLALAGAGTEKVASIPSGKRE